MSKKNTGKYSVPGSEGEILPNLLGLTTKEQIDDAEFKGFLGAQIDLIRDLPETDTFDLPYLYTLHKKALGQVYFFAGKLRTVNISKGGFAFPAARFLPQAMEEYEKNMLMPLSEGYDDHEQLVYDLAKSHAELLFIHPFREGNGRAARLFAMLIYLKHTGKRVDFENILKHGYDKYIAAVQAAAQQHYELMAELFRKEL